MTGFRNSIEASYADSHETLSPQLRRALLEEIGIIALVIGGIRPDTALPITDPVKDPVTAPMREAVQQTANTVTASSALTNPFASPVSSLASTSPLERLYLLEKVWITVDEAFTHLIRHPEGELRSQSWFLPLDRSSGGVNVAEEIARKSGAASAWRSVRKNRDNVVPAVFVICKNETDQNETNKEDKEDRDDANACADIRGQSVVREVRPQMQFDTASNRFAATLLRDIEREARQLASLARLCADTDALERADRLSDRVTRRLSASIFGCLPSLTLRERASISRFAEMLRRPLPYHTLYKAWRTLRSPLRFDWSDSPLLTLPTLEEWRLYEIWCFLTVACSLTRIGWRCEESEILQRTPEGLRLRPATGRASQLRFRSVQTGEFATLFYQPLFSGANRANTALLDTAGPISTAKSAATSDRNPGFRSLTHPMQPDIVLERSNRLLALDAKYRRYAFSDEKAGAADSSNATASRAAAKNSVFNGERAVLRRDATPRHTDGALLEDIDKMHAYRDAIVYGGQRCVEGAWCLFPGNADAPDRVVYPVSTITAPFGTAGIGAIRLTPASAHTALEALLQLWLADPGSTPP